MKVIICGSRTITNMGILEEVIGLTEFDITEVVCGCANGVDTLGAIWSKGQGIPFMCYPANWLRDGKKAGHLRNAIMADHADCCIAIWDGLSNGTKDMISRMEKKGKKVEVYISTNQKVLERNYGL